MKKSILIGAAVVAAVAIPALAQDMAPGKGRMMAPQTRADVEASVKTRFARLDADRDGAVTTAEAQGVAQKARTDAQARHFDMMDANKDGSLSRAEFDAGHANRMVKRGEPRGPGGEGKGMKRGGRMGGGMGGKMLEAQDANKDGKVTLAEATAAALARFDMVDADRNGTITPEERQAHRAKMRTEWQAKRGTL